MVLIDKSLIKLNQVCKDKNEIITTLATLLNEQGRLHDMQGYIDAVHKREEEVSTNLGGAIAIPHGRCSAVKEPSLLFARLKEAIEWGDEEPVSLVFQIAVPETAGDLHLQILSKLARKLIYDEFKQSLFDAKDEDEILALLSNATGGLL